MAWFSAVILGVLQLGACSGGADDTGAAGTKSSGTAGTSTAGTTGGTAGTGAAGTSTAGTGAAGTSAAAAGTTGGAAGTGAAGTGAAGTSTAGTTGGAAGTSAAGTGGGTNAPDPSAGCNKDVTDSPTAWVTHDITVAKATTYMMRRYWTRPPANYDKTKPIALTLWGQGCGQGGSPENTPMTLGPAAANSVQVELLAPQAQPNHCYSAGPDGDSATSPELPYFDQVLSEVEAAFCIDKNKVFVGGYSSGGWFSSLISCNRASVVKGVGWAAAGLQTNHDPCVGAVPALITRGMNDNGTQLTAAMAAVESLRMRNGCATTSKPWTPVWGANEMKADTSSCVLYDNCMPGFPLVWCPTPGGHTNTEGDTHLTRYALWKLWTTRQ